MFIKQRRLRIIPESTASTLVISPLLLLILLRLALIFSFITVFIAMNTTAEGWQNGTLTAAQCIFSCIRL